MLNRIIFSDNGTLRDFSVALDNYHQGSESLSFVASEDKIFIGSHFPFNHRYFKVETPNTLASNITIRYWNGDEFVPVVEVIDETSVSGVPFSKSGFITWTPDKLEIWDRDDTIDLNGIPQVTGLEGITIYDLYWIEITFDSDLDAGTVLSWVGHLFSNDDDLGAEFPDLIRPNVITSFEAGKLNWQEQHVKAASIIIDDLIAKKVVFSGNQFLERRKLINPSVMKTAEIIFSAFGDDYNDDRTKARNEYMSRIKKGIFDIDKDRDATLSPFEKTIRQGRLHR